MDKFTNDNKIDSSYTKSGFSDEGKVINYLQTLAKQIGSGQTKVEECILENENGKYYFGVRFIPS
jgi:hypothetical protein